MGGLNVKNTIVEQVLQIIAPHPCYGCGKIGSVLCDYCKYDIECEPFSGCILCGGPQMEGICTEHKSSIERAFVVGQRSDTLETMINALKFHNAKAVARPLAVLLDDIVPLLPADTVLVPLPTVRSHIRQRGFDQVELIVRHFSELRKMPVVKALRRVTSDTQHKVGKVERAKQAARAFALNSSIDLKSTRVLLVDDIVTTGASLQAAAQVLTNTGATVWVATLAYQPLDTTLD